MYIHVNSYIWNALFLINPALALTYANMVGGIQSAMTDKAYAIERKAFWSTDTDTHKATDWHAYAMAQYFDGKLEGANNLLFSEKLSIKLLCQNAGVDITGQELYITENA